MFFIAILTWFPFERPPIDNGRHMIYIVFSYMMAIVPFYLFNIVRFKAMNRGKLSYGMFWFILSFTPMRYPQVSSTALCTCGEERWDDAGSPVACARRRPWGPARPSPEVTTYRCLRLPAALAPRQIVEITRKLSRVVESDTTRICVMT